jgi:alkylhydroperoxidase family enzyme
VTAETATSEDVMQARTTHPVKVLPESPYFSDAERAALALAECLTRLADRSDAVPDAVWATAADHYDEKELSSLLVSISAINVWNRLDAATRQPVGAAW